MKKIIVTSALPYSNGDLHIGHLLEYLHSDTWVRFRKMLGEACYFFCADDTHGTPIMIAATKRGISPETLINEQRALHLKEFRAFHVDFTHYSYTHSDTNKKLCHEFYYAMQKSGKLEKRRIEQSFCETCGMFLPDRFIRGTCPKCKTPDQYGDVCENCGSTYSPQDLIDPTCSTCSNKPILKETEHLFFRLEEMSASLKAWVHAHTSKEVANHLAKWFADGLQAWNISRDAPYFGFEIPDLPGKYFYVWVDAPIGYISSSQEWSELQDDPSFSEHWKDETNEIVHFIGKDLVYFHALFWPAMLSTAGYAKPKRLFVHGFLTLNGKKMSKSKGTFILAKTYLKSGLPPDYLRYYFLSKLNGSIEDVDFKLTDFKNRINAELIGKITNLASRSITMLHKRHAGILAEPSKDGEILLEKCRTAATAIHADYMDAKFNLVIIQTRKLAEEANQYFNHHAPWTLPHTEDLKVATIASDVIQVFRMIVIFLTPALPVYSQKARHLLGEDPEQSYLWSDLKQTLPAGQQLHPYEHLAKRISDEELSKILQTA